MRPKIHMLIFAVASGTTSILLAPPPPVLAPLLEGSWCTTILFQSAVTIISDIQEAVLPEIMKSQKVWATTMFIQQAVATIILVVVTTSVTMVLETPGN